MADQTLPSILMSRLDTEPDAEACRLVGQDGSVEPVTVSCLMRKAMAYANHFDGSEGRVVVVCLDHGLDLLASFVGAMLAGCVPTMLAPPSPRMEQDKYLSSFLRIQEHVAPDHLVMDSVVRARLNDISPHAFGSLEILDPVEIGTAAESSVHMGRADDIAFLQHSSGTTGLQKGVAVSHRAVLTHNARYKDRLGLTSNDVIVSWLPLYHDMGLVACFLLPLLERVLFVQMSPFDWVRRPAMLLEQITRNGGTLCWMPNFAFSLLAASMRAEQDSQDLDLSSVRAWINSSEPVRHDSHQVFIDRFKSVGARESQLTASYAMAENVYAVTQSRPRGYRTLPVDREVFQSEHRATRTDQEDALLFVSNGRPVEGTEISVWDEAGHLLPDGHVGEIFIRGEHLFSCYFERVDLTDQALSSDGWFKTGDLGFVHENELYVTGRKKDLIIIHGENFYPADIEGAVGKIDGIVAGRVVAFGVSDELSGSERLIILAEVESGQPGSERALALVIRRQVAQELDCTPGDVRLLPRRWLVKSTSGKIARADNRAKYLRHFVNLPK